MKTPTNSGIKTQFGVVLILPLFVISVIVFAAAGYYFFQQSQTKEPDRVSSFQGTPGDENNYAGGLFQETLSQNCYEVSDNNMKVITISLSTLPLTFDKNVLVIQDDLFSATCQGNQGNDYVSIKYDADHTMRVYDDESEELGHGGPSFLGPIGTLIKNQGDVDIYAYLVAPGVGDAYIGEAPLYIRGIKKIKIGNSFYFYVSTDRLMLNGEDDVWVSYLDKYSTPAGSGEKGIKISEAERDLKTGFLLNLSKLSPAQSEALAFVESTLAAVNSGYKPVNY